METPKNKPWNFCETPEEKCTMNYCDENGCQSRKRNLVEPKKSKAVTFILDQIDKAIEKSTLEQQIEKTETLYRKVAVSERKPIKSGTYFSNEEEVYYRESTKKFEHNYDAHCVYPQWWLEEIPDPTAQLKADKAELLEILNETFLHITPLARFLKEPYQTGLKSRAKSIESLIQKMKQ